jgi:malonyl-CoA decarboxylase
MATIAETQAGRLLDRTLRNLRGTWREIAGSARLRFKGGALRPDLPDEDLARLEERMQACIEARGGEVSARARAADLGRSYLGLSEAGRGRFLSLLARSFATDEAAVAVAARAYLEAGDDGARVKAAQALREALVPRSTRLLTQFTTLPDGVKFLVDLRADVMERAGGDAALAALDAELKRLLASWFDVGFLDLRRITWSAPATLLEKLIAYEAVHEIRSWQDLKNRLDSDRRCFAFFHPRMPEEPLIFVEVALVKGIAGNVQALLDEAADPLDPARADTAIFYSISSAQKGLAGISFGDVLIKRVVDELAADLPHIGTFATLSPLPGFRAWLDPLLAAGAEDLFTPAEAQALMRVGGGPSAPAALAALLAGPWIDRPEQVEAMKGPLKRLAARYLVREKRGGRPIDPVARFHLANGARIERLNALADTSPKGLRASAGMMVNYLYKQSDIEDNHEAFAGEGRIATSSAVANLLKR